MLVNFLTSHFSVHILNFVLNSLGLEKFCRMLMGLAFARDQACAEPEPCLFRLRRLLIFQRV